MSEAIRGLMQIAILILIAISERNQWWQSVAISGNQWQSVAIATTCGGGQSVAIATTRGGGSTLM